MPSVRMRRITRGFGVSKSVDGARVLRSGRRLWPESGDIKLRRHKNVDDWFRLLNRDGNGGRSGRRRFDCKRDQEQKLSSKPRIFTELQQEDAELKTKPTKPAAIPAPAGGGSRSTRSDTMFGIVYSRKRKPTFPRDENCIFSSNFPHSAEKPALHSSSKIGSRKRQRRNVSSSSGVQTRRSSLKNTKGRKRSPNLLVFKLDQSCRKVVAIPVPGVHEVSGYVDGHDQSFCIPDSYISSNSDEVRRALAKKTANYDMDTDDERWLDELNTKFLAQNELHELVSEEKFELMIDAFEKGCYCSAEDALNEEDAASLCLDLGRKEVIEAVHGYWMNKREQKKSPLLRVFQVQGNEPRRPPLIPKPPLRKRRSFKRQPSQVGRDKLPA